MPAKARIVQRYRRSYSRAVSSDTDVDQRRLLAVSPLVALAVVTSRITSVFSLLHHHNIA